MNVDNNEDRDAEKLRKPYHAPELTTLGPIQSVVKVHAGCGTDCGPCFHSATAS
jgi:hypothetical protein